ncbi:MAG TPA: toll/interleukin-1 receptor domain-containing protein [Allosphingosinicella sp.]|nr:toll/interleukin-1 receptor domain-containing protein [Allosphingosinicella sp.]
MAERASADVRYTAFLSYSHKDAAAAGRLHRRLEAYRLPKRLAGSQGTRGVVPDRLWPIFRDREELPAATDLSETVREALARSNSLIVLCSPDAAQSLWVAEEIETFRRLHPDRPILAAILDGEPPHCFPAALRAFGRDGTWHEPLATDLRRGRDGAHLGLLKLVAGITGVGLDQLVQRDAARRIRRVTAVTIGALAAMLIMGALALVALDSRREAQRQRAEAEGLIEFMLTDLRERLRGVGRLDVLTAVNRRALSFYGAQQGLGELSADSLERRARILLAMGEDDLARRNFPAALSAFREAHRTTAEQLERSPGDPERIFAHAQSEYWVGYVDYVRNDLAAARGPWTRYKALADRLVAIDRANPAWLREAGYADGNLCTLAMSARADPAAALRICASSLERMEAAARRQRPDPALLVALANRHGWMVDVWSANGRWDRALAHRARHEALARSLIRSDPANLDYRDIWMKSQFGFGQLLKARGRDAEAQLRFGDAAATAAILRARDPDNESWRTWQQRIAEQQERSR